MAFPLIFMEADGTVRTFRWPEYPMVVARVPGMLPVSFDQKILSPRNLRYTEQAVYCGPAGPLPASTWTADEWCEAVYEWLWR